MKLGLIHHSFQLTELSRLSSSINSVEWQALSKRAAMTSPERLQGYLLFGMQTLSSGNWLAWICKCSCIYTSHHIYTQTHKRIHTKSWAIVPTKTVSYSARRPVIELVRRPGSATGRSWSVGWGFPTHREASTDLSQSDVNAKQLTLDRSRPSERRFQSALIDPRGFGVQVNSSAISSWYVKMFEEDEEEARYVILE